MFWYIFKKVCGTKTYYTAEPQQKNGGVNRHGLSNAYMYDSDIEKKRRLQIKHGQLNNCSIIFKKLLTRKGQLCIITIEQMFNCLREQAGS